MIKKIQIHVICFLFTRYNEVCNPGYSFLRDNIPGGTLSFTQMIWKPTKRFGIGKATSHEDGMFCTYIVSLYDEKGNNRDEYANNVLKGDFDFGYCDSLGKEHRQTFRRYQRGRVEEKLLINKTNEANKTGESSKTNDTRIDKKDVFSSDFSKYKNKTTNDENNIESVLRPEDIVLSIKKIEQEPFPLKRSVLNRKEISNTTRSAIDKNSPLITNSHQKNKSINSFRTGNKKIIVENLMQLNDFVMKVSERTKAIKKKSKDSTKKSKRNR